MIIKLLALTYLCAYASLRLQLLGLFGQRGICPIHDLMFHLRQRVKGRPFWQFPTLFWLGSSDRFLQRVCTLGMVSAFCALISLWTVPSLIVAWICYLSFVQVGSPFLSFQWDALLLEVGFAAIFYALSTPPLPIVVIWFWVIAFRLTFSSGWVKWASGCPLWRCFDALNVHFETQPLPNKGAFFAHHFLKSMSRWICGLVFVVELILPLFFFAPEPVRYIAAALAIGFQLFIMATGNYAFFNVLTIALYLPLFLSWRWFWPVGLFGWIATGIALVMIGLNLLQLLHQVGIISLGNSWLYRAQSMGILSTYGLFAVMTDKREELIIEGSLDGQEWKEYHFCYKSGLSEVAPRQLAPFLHPRLDWQAWFVPFHRTPEPWVRQLCYRLTQGSPEVVALFAHNPFPEVPARQIRLRLRRYHFATLAAWKSSGHWWKAGETKGYG